MRAPPPMRSSMYTNFSMDDWDKEARREIKRLTKLYNRVGIKYDVKDLERMAYKDAEAKITLRAHMGEKEFHKLQMKVDQANLRYSRKVEKGLKPIGVKSSIIRWNDVKFWAEKDLNEDVGVGWKTLKEMFNIQHGRISQRERWATYDRLWNRRYEGVDHQKFMNELNDYLEAGIVTREEADSLINDTRYKDGTLVYSGSVTEKIMTDLRARYATLRK